MTTVRDGHLIPLTEGQRRLGPLEHTTPPSVARALSEVMREPRSIGRRKFVVDLPTNRFEPLRRAA